MRKRNTRFLLKSSTKPHALLKLPPVHCLSVFFPLIGAAGGDTFIEALCWIIILLSAHRLSTSLPFFLPLLSFPHLCPCSICFIAFLLSHLSSPVIIMAFQPHPPPSLPPDLHYLLASPHSNKICNGARSLKIFLLHSNAPPHCSPRCH